MVGGLANVPLSQVQPATIAAASHASAAEFQATVTRWLSELHTMQLVKNEARERSEAAITCRVDAVERQL